MPSISIQCPGCSRPITVPKSIAGRRGRCPDCGKVFVIPSPSEPFPAIHAVPRESLSWPDPAVEAKRLDKQITFIGWSAIIMASVLFFVLLIAGITSLTSSRPVTVNSSDEMSEQQTRLLTSEECFQFATAQAWGGELREIPATVIDKGVLQHVPYRSYRSGDYEFNIYGDPSDPACVEIGLYNELKSSGKAKTDCLRFIRAALRNADDQVATGQLSIDKGIRQNRGLVFEVTPDTDEDAYGGWWLSVYDEKLLKNSRANDAELQQITIRRDDIPVELPASPQTQPQALTASAWTQADLQYARKAVPIPSVVPRMPAVPYVGSTSSGRVSAPKSAHGGSVYVHGYTKKNGTYVQPHTRSAPHSSSGSSRRR